MLLPDWSVLNAIVEWLSHGLWDLTWWEIVLYTLVTTHITIASVTIYLHRHQAHRAMDLHAIPAHFFRFWLWIGTGQVTREWAAIHRKHHAKCETSRRSAQSGGPRYQESVLARRRAVPCRVQEPGDTEQVQPGLSERLARAQSVFAFQLARRRPDDGAGPGLVRRRRAGGLGGPDGVDSVHGSRHHQRHRPLLGLSQLRSSRRQHQYRALGPSDRRRGTAQQPPYLPDLGQVLGQAVRVRYRLGLYQRCCRAWAWRVSRRHHPNCSLATYDRLPTKKRWKP